MKNTYSIEAMSVIARTKKGECLSEEYNGQKSKLEWLCYYGHIWEANPNSIINLNSWCPECAGNKKLSIEQIKELAKLKGGICLSNYYINSKAKMLWECEKGHKWYATTFSIKNRNSWCPECYRN